LIYKNSPRDYAEIGAAFVILVGILLVLNELDFLPQRFAVSDDMSYALVFVIGLVASISTCIAVTGGLLVAVAAKYNEASRNLTSVQRLKPHIYFNVGRIVSYTLLGGAVGALGSALTLSAEMNGILTIVASVVMILLGPANAQIVPFTHPPHSDEAEAALSPHPRPGRAPDQGRRFRIRRSHLLSALRVHASACALCSRKG
jgi:cytochrome c biogenesis protein CcdA